MAPSYGFRGSIKEIGSLVLVTDDRILKYYILFSGKLPLAAKHNNSKVIITEMVPRTLMIDNRIIVSTSGK